jgi:hypothetical protein
MRDRLLPADGLRPPQKSDAHERIWIVHRLDRETSGLMVFAKTPEAKATLQGAWEQVTKRYEAVVEGALPKAEGVLESDLDERNPFKVYSAPASAERATRSRVIECSVANANSASLSSNWKLDDGIRSACNSRTSAVQSSAMKNTAQRRTQLIGSDCTRPVYASRIPRRSRR